MVLGKLPVPGRPTIWITVGQGPTALAVGAGGVCLDIFTLIYPFFPLSPSLWETARYRLKYCLKGPLNPKPTNQPNVSIRFKSRCLLCHCEMMNIQRAQSNSVPVFLSFTRAQLFKTNDIVSLRDVKISNVDISNMSIFFVEKL